MKCPHCGTPDSYILGGYGCTLTIPITGKSFLPREKYFWRCCSTPSDRRGYLDCILSIIDEISQHLSKKLPRLNKLFLFYELGGKTKEQYRRFQNNRPYRQRCVRAGRLLNPYEVSQ